MRITEKMMSGTYTRNMQRNVSNLSSSNLKLSSQPVSYTHLDVYKRQYLSWAGKKAGRRDFQKEFWKF